VSDQASLGLDGPAPAPITEERRAEFDVDRTPLAIARQTYEALAGDLPEVRRILIPAAGSGPWAQAARERWPKAWILAVEVREEERSVLGQWCDHVITGDIRDVVPRLVQEREPVDLIADNPPFSLVPSSGGRKSQAEALRAFVVNLRPLLAPRGLLALYWLSDLGQRATGEAARALWDENRPIFQMRVQPVEHREGKGVDLRSYWVWERPDAETALGGRWWSWDLPALPKSARRWTPGA
jgi:hypothetical protein